jgi:hypothetical protein
MSTLEAQTNNGQTSAVPPGNYSPVRVNDTVGTVFLGIVSIALLIAYLRAEARTRALLTRPAGGR